MEGSQAENQAESWERSQSGEKVESTPAVDPARLKHLTLRLGREGRDLHVAGEGLVVTEGREDLSVREDLGERLEDGLGRVEVVLTGLEPHVVSGVVPGDHDVLQGGPVLLLDLLQHLGVGPGGDVTVEVSPVTGGSVWRGGLSSGVTAAHGSPTLRLSALSGDCVLSGEVRLDSPQCR